jgi:ribosomal protein L11 methylase PrmA
VETTSARSEPTAASTPRPHPASYRDPDARVLVHEGRILRAFNEEGAKRFDAVRRTGLLERLESQGRVVRTVDSAFSVPGAALAVEHETIPFISYPYEWPFTLLKRAALLHLDVQLEALASGVVLADATAYNVQFRGVSPVFIDLGAFRPYREGELWGAHRQFCDQFLNPLLLACEVGVDFQPLLRGSLEGIAATTLAPLLGARRWMSPRFAMHVLLPAKAEGMARRREAASVERIRQAKLPREGYRALLRQLRAWIQGLAPREALTPWADYAAKRTYADSEIAVKRRVVEEFAAQYRPAMLWDIGCNDGEFTAAALRAGAARATGFDADLGSLERAIQRASHDELALLPLRLDAADPSPGLGWRNRERTAWIERGPADAVMALAFVHHLALGRNVPLEEVVDLLVSVAPRGLVEFVPKDDSTSRRMLALKGDIFPGYTAQAFEQHLSARARIARTERVSASGRTLYVFER